MNKYEIILYWSDEDEAFIAEVPDLPGCMADGATRHEALANAEAAIDLWIETARELGRPIPEDDFGTGKRLREYRVLMRRIGQSGVHAGRTFTREEMNER